MFDQALVCSGGKVFWFVILLLLVSLMFFICMSGCMIAYCIKLLCPGSFMLSVCLYIFVLPELKSDNM